MSFLEFQDSTFNRLYPSLPQHSGVGGDLQRPSLELWSTFDKNGVPESCRESVVKAKVLQQCCNSVTIVFFVQQVSLFYYVVRKSESRGYITCILDSVLL